MLKIGLDAQDIREAIRRRHPAYELGQRSASGMRWVTTTEWMNIDLLALDCWRSAEVVGYEVKVSRGDYKSELLNPDKRVRAVSMCTRFYFAVPAGLLTAEEREWEEPDWELEDYERPGCTNPQCRASRPRRGWHKSSPKPRGTRLRGTEREGVTIDLGTVHDSGTTPGGSTYTQVVVIKACCAICKGYGTTGLSRVERESPQLWIPKDVGLVAIGNDGSYAVLREAPRRKVTEPIIGWPFTSAQNYKMSPEDSSRTQRQAINVFARWISQRPDPRHHQSYSDRMTE